MARTPKTRATKAKNALRYNNRVVTSISKKGLTKYRSKFESDVGKTNPYLIYEPTTIKYEREYRPDFKFVSKTGKEIYVECKGFFRNEDRSKMIAVKRCNPNLDIRLLFVNANQRLTKNKGSFSYGEWADVHGFIWAQGIQIPFSWLDE